MMAKKMLKNYPYLILTVMLSQTAWLIEMMAFRMSKQALPTGIHLIGYILNFLLGYIALTIYFRKDSQSLETPLSRYLIKSFLPAGSSFFGIALVYALSSSLYKVYIGVFANAISNPTLGFVAIIGFIVGIWLMLFLLLSFVVLMIAIYQYELPIAGLGRYYGKVLLELMKRVLSFTGLALFLVASVYLLRYILLGSSILITSIYGVHFLNAYMQWIVSSVLVALLLSVLFNYGKYVLKKSEIKILKMKEKKSLLPIFSIGIVVLAIFINILAFPIETHMDQMIFKEIDTHIQKGDLYGQMGLAEKSINEYNLAFSKLYAFRGYLHGLIALDEKDEDRTQAYNKGLEDFKLADSYHPQNPYTPYFRGKMIAGVEENYPLALEQFYIAVSMRIAVEEAQFQIYYLQDQEDDEELRDKALAILTQQKRFYDPYEKIDQLSIKKVEKYMDELDDLEEELGTRKLFKAIEKAKYNDYSGAITDLLALQNDYPKDATIAYYLAQYYNAYRNETANYEATKKNTIDFIENYDEKLDAEMEIAKGLFAAQMFMGANDYESSLEEVEALYDDEPENLQVLSQYAYLLTKFERYDDVIDILKEFPEDEAETAGLYYLRALSTLKKNDIQKSLEDISHLITLLEEGEAFLAEVDYYLYLYALEFSAYWTVEGIVESVESIQDVSILYNYLYAIKGWKDKDSSTSNGFVEKVIAENEALGYAHYIQGINYFEATVREGTNDFSKAELSYLKSVELLPNHAEGYFALAHCYKKAGENLPALRAFRKVVDLMPFEDHRTDPYGITVHAMGEISSLLQYEGK